MSSSFGNPVVHLELRSGNVSRACEFFTRLLGWRAETVHVGSATYIVLDQEGQIDVGVVQYVTRQPRWLPYVEVADVHAATQRARALGAIVRLGPTEGPAGWRSLLVPPDSGEIGLWQPKP